MNQSADQRNSPLANAQGEPADLRRLVYEFGPFRLDPGSRELTRQGVAIPLRPKSFDLLCLLVSHAGQVMLKEELLGQIWPRQIVEESNLAQHIFILRRALDEDPHTPGNPGYILTVPGAGYLFFATVRPVVSPGHQTIPQTQPGPPSAPNAPSIAGGEAAMDDSRPAPVATALQSLERRRVSTAIWILLILLLAAAGVLFAGLSQVKKRHGRTVITPFVTTPGMKDSIAFSPRGEMMAFSAAGDHPGSLSIFVRDLHQGDLRRLTWTDALDRRISWSPDGRTLAFLRNSGRNGERYRIYTISAAGGAEQLIGEAADGLDWSPDGRSLAISDHPAAANGATDQGPMGPVAIHLLSLPDGEKRQLTFPPATENHFDHDARFSPDGQSIAFIRWQTPISGDIFLLDLPGGVPRQLTFDQRPVRSLQWSPDGRELFFVSTRGGNSRIWRISREGGSPRLIDGIIGEVDRFAISPLDQRLVFSQVVDNANLERHHLPRPGRPWPTGTPAPLPCRINSTRTDNSPQFSPDGQRIAFVSKRSGYDEIWLTDPECRQTTQLTYLRPRGLGRPRWSPDGALLAFDYYFENQSDIFTIELIGGRIRRITDHPAQDVMPSWSRDGRFIYFASLRASPGAAGGVTQIWRVAATGGAATQVTRQGGEESWESFDGTRLIYSSGELLFEKNLRTGIEAPIQDLADQAVGRYWTVTPSGIFFISQRPGCWSLLQHYQPGQPGTGRISVVGAFDGLPNRYLPGLTVSPDEKMIMISLRPPNVSELRTATNWE